MECRAEVPDTIQFSSAMREVVIKEHASAAPSAGLLTANQCKHAVSLSLTTWPGLILENFGKLMDACEHARRKEVRDRPLASLFAERQHSRERIRVFQSAVALSEAARSWLMAMHHTVLAEVHTAWEAGCIAPRHAEMLRAELLKFRKWPKQFALRPDGSIELFAEEGTRENQEQLRFHSLCPCLLYTSDAADEEDSVDLGGRRIIKKKKKREVRRVVRETQTS
eukprot:TRINITY_DN7879_c0_g1_i1.p2 TRINITY_DN7879_c0_g1~~TRINITY_DN7879_c0_g1_i1.p2  ORF type:complete len:224 (-),score=58.12 TRINITY_DN7879_c0_g1_i1:54-725(-)